MSKINYVVNTAGWDGKHRTECETIEEVYKAIGKALFGSLIDVGSPTGKDVSQWVSF